MIRWLKQEFVLLGWFSLLLLLSAIYITLNFSVTHYQGCGYQLDTLLCYVPWGVGMFLISVYLHRYCQQAALLFDAVSKLYWVFLIYALGCYAIQFTPFHLVDTSLLHFDQSLGFNSAAIYHFTMTHPAIRAVAHSAYDSIGYQLFIIPLILVFLSEQRKLNLFFTANLVSAFIAYNLYYFFPTTVPAHVLPLTHFSLDQYQVIAQWYEIHFYLNNIIHVGDLIGFPSYHVIWAVLLTEACSKQKWLFYPVMLLNSLLIAATLELGWHFLSDVFGGLIIGVISIYVARVCFLKCDKQTMKVLKSFTS